MKPGDHPDFFRLPPPPGRSRESKITLDAQGVFYNDGIPFGHVGMTTAFFSWIRRHPDDGRYILTNGYDWTYFTVEDAPFFVRGVDVAGDTATLHLSDGTQEELDPSAVLTGEGDALYVRVKGGEFVAKFTPSAQAALVDLIDEGEGGEPVVVLAEGRFRIGVRG